MGYMLQPSLQKRKERKRETGRKGNRQGKKRWKEGIRKRYGDVSLLVESPA